MIRIPEKSVNGFIANGAERVEDIDGQSFLLYKGSVLVILSDSIVQEYQEAKAAAELERLKEETN
jgi:hypothetical protein